MDLTDALTHLKSIFWVWGGWGERLFEVGRLLTFSTFRVGAYSKWAWTLNRINTGNPQRDPVF